MFETVKTDVFTRSVFDTKLPESDFMMIVSSILESCLEPSSLTYILLVIQVAKTVHIFKGNVTMTENDSPCFGRWW